MPLSHIEHYLLQTDDIECTCDWYERVLGMHRGPHPDFKFPVAWLYLGERDIVHVTQGGGDVSENRKRYVGQQSEDTRGSGAIDHIAFRCSGLREMLAHLKAQAVPFRERQVDDQGLYQLFLMDPNDIKIELNFPAAEAAGITPGLRASDL